MKIGNNEQNIGCYAAQSALIADSENNLRL